MDTNKITYQEIIREFERPSNRPLLCFDVVGSWKGGAHYTRKELLSLVDNATNPSLKIGLWLLAFLGLSLVEIQNLKVRDFRLARGFISLSGRFVPFRIVDSLPSDLRYRLESARGEDKLILKSSRSSIYAELLRISKLTGVGYTPIKLQENFINWHLLRGVDPYYLAFSVGVSYERVSQFIPDIVNQSFYNDVQRDNIRLLQKHLNICE